MSIIEINSHRIESVDGSKWAVRRDLKQRKRASMTRGHVEQWTVKSRVDGKAVVVAIVSVRASAEALVAA